jgi:hypothetical protein
MQRFMSYEQKSCSFSTNTGNSNNSNSEDMLKQFPKIKFSYESKPYKKVSQNKNNNSIAISNNESEQNKEFYFIIPKGKKYLVWFKNNECYFLELDAQRKIVSVTKKNVSHAFPNNTILYGTHFYIRQQQQISNRNNCGDTTYYFTIENIHYYNGLHLDATSVFDKFKKIDDFFKQQQQQQQQQQLNSQKQHHAHAVEIGLPHVSSSLKGASDIKSFYSAFCIQKKDYKNTSNEYENVFYFNSVFNSSSVVLPAAPAAPVATAAPTPFSTKKIYTNNNYNNSNSKYKIFIVRADLQNDVYHLSNPDDNDDATVNSNEQLIASIPDYKTSVMMNSLFRNIKENNSLDALEESDNEDEFENINIDKFVDLSKKIKMKCIYNYKFKKWTPISQINI